MKKVWLFMAACAAASAAAAAAPNISGMTPEAAGTALIEHAEDYHSGWDSSHARTHMRMYDERGKETRRQLEVYALERGPDSDAGRSFIIYDKAGTGVFTHMFRGEPDRQWLWLPGLRERKRINSDGLGASFMGSEFAYEDFRSQYPGKYRNRLLKESQVDGQPAWVIERIPQADASGYGRLLVYLEKEHFRVVRTDFFDKANRPLKHLTAQQWELRDGRFWRPMANRMENLQTRRATVWVTDSITLNAGLKTLNHLMK